MAESVKGRKKQNLLGGAMWLVLSMVIVKVIGAVYKIPLTSILGPVGKSYYSTAYNLFIPVYSIALAGLPVAISKTVSHYVALERYRDVRNVLKASKRVFLVTGIIGTAVILAMAYPYVLSINNFNAVYAIIVIAPSVFFCCLMSAYRGYYNGLKNMIPTATSEVLEALGKLVFGLAFSKLIIAAALQNAVPGGTVFGLLVTETTTHEEIMSAIYPFAAAGGIGGVTIGTVMSTLFLMLRHKLKGDSITHSELENSPEPSSVKAIAKELLTIAVPIVASTLIFNLINIIDSWSIQNRLAYLITEHGDVIQSMYSSSLANTVRDDWKNYLYGAYETAVDFKNMIPTLTLTLGVSAIPVLSEAWTLKRKHEIKSSIESVIRVCMMIALPAGFGMAVLSKQILNILYFSSPETLSAVPISSKVMFWYGVTICFMAVSQPLTYMLQAIGKTKITVISVAVGAVLKVILNFAFISIPEINIYGAVIGTVACSLVTCVINLVALIKYCNVKINFVSTFVKPLICSLMCAASAWSGAGLLERVLSSHFASEGLMSASNISAVIAIVIAVIVYALALLFSRSISEEDVKMMPKGEKICKVLAKFNFIG